MSKDGRNGLTPPANSGDDADREQPSDRTVGQEIQNHLGRKLKATYDDLVQQPVPDKFRQLLDELERQEKKQ
jgi:Anti-sigma factor NepR